MPNPIVPLFVCGFTIETGPIQTPTGVTGWVKEERQVQAVLPNNGHNFVITALGETRVDSQPGSQVGPALWNLFGFEVHPIMVALCSDIAEGADLVQALSTNCDQIQAAMIDCGIPLPQDPSLVTPPAR